MSNSIEFLEIMHAFMDRGDKAQKDMLAIIADANIRTEDRIRIEEAHTVMFMQDKLLRRTIELTLTLEDRIKTMTELLAKARENLA